MDINLKIKEVKERLSELTKHFPYTEEQINIFTICYIAMAAIDNDITDLLDEVFSREYILFNNGSFDKVLKSIKAPYKKPGFHLNPDFDLGDINNVCEFIGINLRKTRIFSKTVLTLLFEYIMHEVKHAINVIVNNFESDAKNSYCYAGILFYMYDGKNYYRGNLMLDEAFNSFITKIYLQVISNLAKKPITDVGIKALLDSFSLDDDYLYAYEVTEIWKNLFCDEDIFREFYNAALYHDYLALNELLAKIFKSDIDGKNIPFDDLLDYLDELSENYEDSLSKNIKDYFEKASQGYPVRSLKIPYSYENI